MERVGFEPANAFSALPKFQSGAISQAQPSLAEGQSCESPLSHRKLLTGESSVDRDPHPGSFSDRDSTRTTFLEAVAFRLLRLPISPSVDVL